MKIKNVNGFLIGTKASFIWRSSEDCRQQKKVVSRSRQRNTVTTSRTKKNKQTKKGVVKNY